MKVTIPVKLTLPGDLEIDMQSYPFATSESADWVADVELSPDSARVVGIRARTAEADLSFIQKALNTWYCRGTLRTEVDQRLVRLSGVSNQDTKGGA